MPADNAVIILGMAAAVIFTRLAPFVLFGAGGPPAWAGRWLKHVPVAVFAALVAPALLLPHGEISCLPDNHHLVAGVATGVVAWRYRNFVLTVGVGTAVMLVLKYFWQ